MLKYHLKFAFRNFKTNKVIFGGSLLTLCLCTLCIALLSSYVPNELDMDGFHKRKKDIYMLSLKATPQSLPQIFDGKAFAKIDYGAYPEVESKVRISKYEKGDLAFYYNETFFSPEGLIADSTFFQIFDFSLKWGNQANALADPNSIVITEKFAKTMFGEENPMGKVVQVKTSVKKDFTVKGVIIDPPQNSSIEFDFVLPTQTSDPNLYSRMGGDFLLMRRNIDKTAFEEKIKYLAQGHFQFKESTLGLVPFDQDAIERENLNSSRIISRIVDKKNMYMQIVIMLVILLVSVLNFSNLQIIGTNFMIKNNALKRINGAEKGHLISQFIIEKAVLIGLSAIIVTVVFQMLLPAFNSFIGLNYAPPLWQVVAMVGAILSLLVLLGSIYPILTNYSFSIVNGLKGQGFTGNQIAGRKMGVIFQYALTFLLLISSITVVLQLQLMLTKDLGFHKDNIIVTQLFGNQDYSTKEEKQKGDAKKFKNLKNELASNTSIKSYAQGASPLEPYLMDWRRKDGDFGYETQNMLLVTPNYDKVLGLELVEGRFFDSDQDRSRGVRVVINEAARKYWGILDISKSRMLNQSWNDEEGYEIIGVVKDFNYEHLSIGTQPLMMLYFDDYDNPYLIEFEEGTTKRGLAFVADLFKENNPKEDFDYSFLSDEVVAMYKKEKQLGTSVVLFSLIALIISAIGLFAIANYDTQKRVKEIAIRKVNGASISEILVMLNKSVVKWVAVALLIASPIAYYLMDNWLENFAYRIKLSWWTFCLTGIFTLAIALITVSIRSYKAAVANPIKSLRTE